MTRTTDIVVTTIFEPEWLDGYLTNIREHGHQDDVTLRIICDRKTPETVYTAAQSAIRQGFNVDCPSLDEQQLYLKKLGLADDFIPWNTDNRRNIGFMRAWENGASVLVSIDDDNYCTQGSDFIGEHGVVGATAESAGQVAGGAPWYNVCELLSGTHQDAIFPRGFPYAARAAAQQATVGTGSTGKRVAVNAGLWTDDPDVDAITRLAIGPRVDRASDQALLLANETWSPINTQNTALLRDAIPAYYYVRMGFALEGLTIDRFGDILSGYFVQKCAKHLGDAIRIGSPIAEHRRSQHNLFKDLYHELAGIVLIEDLLPWLRELNLTGDDYASTYASLADELLVKAGSFSGFVWDQGGREFLVETATCMQQWLQTIDQLQR